LSLPQPLTLLDAVGLYVSSLKSKSSGTPSQQELLRFAQWCGSDRAMSAIQPSVVEGYGARVVGVVGGAEVSERLKEVRKFLAFALKKGLIDQNLARHLRVPKAKTSRAIRPGGEQQAIELTAEGRAELESELESTRAKRGPLAVEVRLAAADKDVRENVPLEAAREQLGLVESRILEIERRLKAVVIVDPSKRGRAIGMGSTVLLKDLGSGRETRYTLVSAYEAKSLQGKISDASPVGKALLSRTVGQEVEVTTPRGTIRYRIQRVS
jgi:transcription elongation factor GreA